ncbi:translation initiation factor IF-3 [Candidatus Woesebacteria bacterium RBG_19FT_COMBO_47_8]|uniref:Translation initiation factor IF-3 n=1 Tax=Candidatus Woesebacteria bacterium RBG_13_46_13 TaxID=1802479 RepID=A0A1F7X3G2_9BACT|nr:MAG: translation initiation factor IF-3 [Candidatus Woesebacteria bacterium RBG_13_46_13]OGM17611.1 MAG: translation initiation factor IF-3 [Candidatus Woesebacteria bacterium RBG_19FT_COMBO_47_8]HJX59582.1 translation initiation factor IF-3 [Patescibacteria group bacterium]
MKNSTLFWRVNEAIRVPEVRLIGSDGKQLGIIKTAEAIEKAKKAGLTLVEIAPKALPPVAKIVEFGKFRYQEEKKLRSRTKTKGGDIKEVRFSPFIAENDYAFRLSRVKEFLSERNKVRLVVVFKGRQMGSKPFGFALLKRIVQELGDAISIDMEPKFLGKHLIMVISPTAKKIAKKEELDAKTEN